MVDPAVTGKTGVGVAVAPAGGGGVGLQVGPKVGRGVAVASWAKIGAPADRINRTNKANETDRLRKNLFFIFS